MPKQRLPVVKDLALMRPRARVEDIVIAELDGELLVYDLVRHRAHALNPTAHLIWQHCDGQTTVRDLALLRPSPDQPPLAEAVVWLSLRQLADAQLLDAATPLPEQAPKVTRMQLLRAGLASSAVTLPVVATIMVPTAAHAQSVCGGAFQPCCGGTTCDPGLSCQGGICIG